MSKVFYTKPHLMKIPQEMFVLVVLYAQLHKRTLKLKY